MMTDETRGHAKFIVMADFRNLLVWQRSHELNLRVARAAARMRGAAFYSLRGQMIRAALSIPANLVEGRGQPTDAQFAKFIAISINSASELEYHLITARDLGGLPAEEVKALMSELSEIRRMLYGLLRALDKSTPRPIHKTGS